MDFGDCGNVVWRQRWRFGGLTNGIEDEDRPPLDSYGPAGKDEEEHNKINYEDEDDLKRECASFSLAARL